MILTALIAASVVAPIQDYIVITPGAKWTYEDGDGLQLTEEIGAPIDIGKGQTAIPKTDTISGRSSGSELFRIENDTLLLVGYLEKTAKAGSSPLNLMRDPQPILRVGNGKAADWQFLGELPLPSGPTLIQVKGRSDRGPKRKVLDREVETLVVHVVSFIGNEAPRLEVTDDVIYGKGIGMVEMTEATKGRGATVKKMLKLVKFEPPQG